MCYSAGVGGGGGRSLSSDNLLESESGYSSGSQHHHDTGGLRRSRLKKSLSSDGVISSQREPALGDITDSEMPELAPVAPAKSGEKRRRGREKRGLGANYYKYFFSVGQSPTCCNGANDSINLNKTEPGSAANLSNDFLDDNAMDETKRKISLGKLETKIILILV